METFDVAIVGGGPAGASCAAFCARAGLRTLLLEREKFPREKVCGDCINPAAWPVLARLDIAEEMRALPHGGLRSVDFVAIGGTRVSVHLPPGAEIAVKRSLFDQRLLSRAAALGADVRESATVNAVTPATERAGTWTLTSSVGTLRARALVAADGRNSTVARLLGLLPRIEKERVGLQTHVPLPRDFGKRVVLQFLPQGYSGQAPVSEGELNVCLVGKASDIEALQSWAAREFNISRGHVWRTVTPLRRAALPAAREKLFLVGDAARVVEPFTGEGITYALRSGELAAEAITKLISSGDAGSAARSYTAAHEQLYRGRLWVNRIARAAVLSPRVTSSLLRGGALPSPLLRALTAKIVRPTHGD